MDFLEQKKELAQSNFGKNRTMRKFISNWDWFVTKRDLCLVRVLWWLEGSTVNTASVHKLWSSILLPPETRLFANYFWVAILNTPCTCLEMTVEKTSDWMQPLPSIQNYSTCVDYSFAFHYHPLKAVIIFQSELHTYLFRLPLWFTHFSNDLIGFARNNKASDLLLWTSN